jgi:hypothetical protein
VKSNVTGGKTVDIMNQHLPSITAVITLATLLVLGYALLGAEAMANRRFVVATPNLIVCGLMVFDTIGLLLVRNGGQATIFMLLAAGIVLIMSMIDLFAAFVHRDLVSVAMATEFFAAATTIFWTNILCSQWSHGHNKYWMTSVVVVDWIVLTITVIVLAVLLIKRRISHTRT